MLHTGQVASLRLKDMIGRRCIYIWLFVVLQAFSLQGVAKDTSLEKALDDAFHSGKLSGLHSVLVIHEHRVLAEKHFAGDDQRWGARLGIVEHSASSLHDLRSVTKSIVGLLYGIALSEGLVPSLDTKLIAQFPEYADLPAHPRRGRILVRHALSMKMGTKWNEEIPYTDPRNSETVMETVPDRYRYILSRPMVSEPGTTWTYNGGATALIARLIAKGTSVSIDAYADEKLFTPLGIEEFEWIRGRGGEPSAASGLRMNIHDLAKIGQLILNMGVWEGRQIVPAEWLVKSFSSYAAAYEGYDYGFFWWLSPEGASPSWIDGSGNGGQRLMIYPSQHLIVVVFAGKYNHPDAWKLPDKVIDQFVLPYIPAR